MLEDVWTNFVGSAHIELKLWSTAGMLVLTVACCYVPWFIKARFSSSASILSFLNCLAGGIVLGALLMHMIPEMIGHGEHAHGPDGSCSHGAQEDVYNWGSFCGGVSFLVLLAIDRLFLHSHSSSHEHGPGKEAGLQMGEKKARTAEVEHRHATDEECGARVHFADEEDDDCASCHSENVMGGCHMDGLDSHSSKSQAIIFVVALSMHSFLEGLAMATKSTQYALSMYLISLFAHKWLEAFALGVNVMNASFSAGYSMVLIAFYSLLTPFGILLGMLLRSYSLKSVFVSQCLNGLAAGSFLFVSCIEMIPPEFHKKTPQTVWKFAVLCVGFAIMAAIAIIPHEC